MAGSQKCHHKAGTGLKPPEGGQASERPGWMEKWMDVVVVVPEPVEEAWTMEEVVSR